MPCLVMLTAYNESVFMTRHATELTLCKDKVPLSGCLRASGAGALPLAGQVV